MIDYKKLGRIGLDSSDQQKLDQLINVNTDPLISQYDEQFIKHGFVKVDNNRYNLKMSEDSKSVFQITKAIALEQINWLVGVISKILNDETDLKEIDRLRDQLTIEQLTHDKEIGNFKTIEKKHQELNGQLRQEIEETKKDHDNKMMNKIIKYENEIQELKEDNKKLSRQIEDLDKPRKLREKGLM
jgi:vacuolar-type H+-ATPase subunit I/STV1